MRLAAGFNTASSARIGMPSPPSPRLRRARGEVDPTLRIAYLQSPWTLFRARSVTYAKSEKACNAGDSRDLIRSLPVSSASGLPVHVAASQLLRSRLRSE